MRLTLLLLLTLLPLQLLAQGKFYSEAPFHRLSEVEIPKQKRQKQANYKKLRKSNRSTGYKLSLKTAFRMDAAFLNIRNNYNLDIIGDRVFHENTQVGSYSYTMENERQQNVLSLQQGKNTYWQSTELPTEYQYESSLNQHAVYGGSIEWRFIKRDRMGPPSGVFINTGVLMVNETVDALNLQSSELLFPVGLGLIVPGDDRLRVEITTNVVAGIKGSLGVKFDFSFVYQDLIKFGPGFIYTQNTQKEGVQASGLGIHFGVLMPNFKSRRSFYR